MKTYIAHLRPKSAFLNSLPKSDTLFGAICWGYRILFEKEFPSFICSFRETPPCPKLLISSSFPYFESNEETGVTRDLHLLPKPIRKPMNRDSRCLEAVEKAKHYAQVKWVGEGVFERMMQLDFDEEAFYRSVYRLSDSEQPTLSQKTDCENSAFIQIGKALYEKVVIEHVIDQPHRHAPFLEPIVTDTVIHHATDRLDGGLRRQFTRDTARVHRGMGLYFLLRCDADERRRIEAVLRYLSDGGLGGDLGIGRGGYTFDGKLQEMQGVLARQPTPHGFVTLSLFYCSAQQLQSFDPNHIWYELIARKGRVDNLHIVPRRYWKKTTLLFTEASTFIHTLDAPPQTFYGDNPIVSTEADNGCFDVQLFGYAFPVGVGRSA